MSAFAWRRPSATALASSCGVASDFIESADVSMTDSEGLNIPWTASTVMDLHHVSRDTHYLAGDPYPELDNVTRSFDPNGEADVVFKMIPTDDALGMVPSNDALASWTRHEAAVHLGCNKAWFENLSHDVVVMSPVHDAPASWTEHNAAQNIGCNNRPPESHTVQYPRRFQVTDMLPGIPLNVCFRLQPMTYWLRGVDAHVIANMLLDFLTAKVTTTITKVSYAKFSIKVNICIDGSDCVVKLRMYSNGASRALALELQRRCGCGLVFNRFYQEVGCYLTASQKSVQFELLNALQEGPSPVWTSAHVGDDGMAPMSLACSQSQTCRMDAEASPANVAQHIPSCKGSSTRSVLW